MLAVSMARNEGAAAGAFRQTAETVAAPVRSSWRTIRPTRGGWRAQPVCTGWRHRRRREATAGGVT
jgi:hypothetical protein